MQLPVIDLNSPVFTSPQDDVVVFSKPSTSSQQNQNGIHHEVFSEDLFGCIKRMCTQVQSNSGWIGWVAPIELPCRSVFIAYDLPLERFLLIHPREVQTLTVAQQAIENDHISALIISVGHQLPSQMTRLKSLARQSRKPTILLQHEQGVKAQQSIQLSVKEYFAFNRTEKLESVEFKSQLTLFS